MHRFTLPAIGMLTIAGFTGCADGGVTEAHHSPSAVAEAHNAQGGAEIGTTAGWLDGESVTFVYNKDFFCKSPPSSDADSGRTLGAEPEVAPDLRTVRTLQDAGVGITGSTVAFFL